jgi:hypothetical protein
MDEKKSDPEFTCLQLSEKRKLERYGHHSVWQMHTPARGEGINKPINYWFQAIESPGAWQIRHARDSFLANRSIFGGSIRAMEAISISESFRDRICWR